MAVEQHEIEFTRDGVLFDEAPFDALLGRAAALTDLLVVAHGWNNDRAEAGALYDALAASLDAVIGADVVTGLQGRALGILRVLWPSKRFADHDLIPGGGAASATRKSDDALLTLLSELKRNPLRLGDETLDPIRQAHLDAAIELVPRLDGDPAARREFVLLCRSILDPSDANGDDGSEEFFTLDPEELFARLEGDVVAPGAPAGPSGAGGAAGLGDLEEGALAAARRIANYGTYYEMKQRAGTVGRAGLAPVLRRLRDRAPGLRLHLVGHSFGGRLVTAATNAMPAGTPAFTLSLLQAAFSHNSLSDDYDGAGTAGAFRPLVSERRASGPVFVTHTKNDQAVGIAYPLASRIARDRASALGDENDPYGGMGRNGARHTTEAEFQNLEPVGFSYAWRSGAVYNLKADRFISNHGDVTGPEVANAILHAVASV